MVHWKLDEGSGTVAHDASGNGHDGTFKGAPQWVTGKIGGALQFDGVDDFVVHSLPQVQTFAACTIALLVKADTVGQAQSVSGLSLPSLSYIIHMLILRSPYT